MEIKKLIEAFELAIPTYQKAVDEKWSEKEIYFNEMDLGICWHLSCKGICVYDVFKDYYMRLLKDGDLFSYYSETKSIYKSIKPRLDFMKSEVKDLKRLLKQGYTHV